MVQVLTSNGPSLQDQSGCPIDTTDVISGVFFWLLMKLRNSFIKKKEKRKEKDKVMLNSSRRNLTINEKRWKIQASKSSPALKFWWKKKRWEKERRKLRGKSWSFRGSCEEGGLFINRPVSCGMCRFLQANSFWV